MNEELFERAKVLLKATLDLLNQQKESPFVLNMLETTAVWDGAECEGYCLCDDIELFFEEVMENDTSS